MTATLTTKQIKDGGGLLVNRRVLDVTDVEQPGVIALQVLAKADGSGVVDIDALNAALVEAIGDAAIVLPTGAATDAGLAAILAKLSADPATQTTLAAVLAKLSNDPATNAGLAAIFDKLPAAPALDASLGGTAAAAAGDSGASTTNGYLRKMRDIFVAGVSLGAGQAVIGKVGGIADVPSGSVTRPADTAVYATGDLIANATAAGSMAPIAIAAARVNGGTGVIRKVRLSTSNAAWANNTVRVHLFRGAPTSSVGDNGVFSGNIAGIAAVPLGYADVTFDRAFSDGAAGEGAINVGADTTFKAAGGTTNIYALLEVRGAYAPASGQTFTVALEVLQD